MTMGRRRDAVSADPFPDAFLELPRPRLRGDSANRSPGSRGAKGGKPRGAHRESTRGARESRRPSGVRSSKIAPETIALAVSNAKDSVQIRLIRYANPGKQKVLLIHGLAHGACIFTTNTVTTPLAAYLYDRGLEPWLLGAPAESRTSRNGRASVEHGRPCVRGH
jgi:hypothetical protein